MPLARTRPPVRPTVRLRPAPPLDPPFDDEHAAAAWFDLAPRSGAAPPAPERFRSSGAAEGPALSPAVRVSPAGTAPSSPAARRGGRGTARRGGPATAPTGAPAGTRAGAPTTTPPSAPGQAPAGALAGATPEARQAAKRFLDTCLEIVNGYRPAGHVRALASPADAAGMVAQLSSAASRVSGRRRPGQPVRTLRLRRLRVCEPRPGVVEAAAAVGTPGRTWALAFRIERRRGSWVGVSVALL
ncbi:Rv3235 family protein [Plantactinospora sp. WMMC1484]|uniref:Rv3235 family protein n=1 Tax=Plantactinospora sp. WMMC1484 TaxID=3404122 RepID=UPI003BF4C29C